MLRTRVTRLKDGFSLLLISPRLALMYKALKRAGRNGRKDRIQCAYFGFDTEAEAQAFADYLKNRFESARAVVRESDRLPECGWEVKVWEFPALMSVVLRCAEKPQLAKAA